MRNHSYENDFDLHENETACRTYLHVKGFALRLVLKLRHKRTRKWPIERHETAVALCRALLLTFFPGIFQAFCPEHSRDRFTREVNNSIGSELIASR